MAQETELKLTLSLDDVPKVRAWLAEQAGIGAEEMTSLRNIYFDTPRCDLQAARMALRIRQAGARYIQTLKTRGQAVAGVHQRNEWEWNVAGWALDTTLLPADILLASDLMQNLAPVFETNFERQTAMLSVADSQVECAIDVGAVLAGDARLGLCEVEFELKAGTVPALWSLAGDLAARVPVMLNPVSKAEQGYYLAGLAPTEVSLDLGGISDGERFAHWLRALGLFHLRGRQEDALAAWGHLWRMEALAQRCGHAEHWAQVVAGQWRTLAQVPAHLHVGDVRLGQLQLALARQL